MKPSDCKPSPRYVLCALILLLSLFALYIITIRLIAQTHIHRAGNLFREGYYGLALTHLKKADRCQPGNYRIQKELGNVYYKLAGLQPGVEKTFSQMRTAQEHYLKAFRLNPLDAEAAYALARGEEGLEQLDRRLQPENKNIKYNPLPYFRDAIRLRPNGIMYHYALARYLYRQGKEDELLSTVSTLTRIYPPACRYLKKEAFWSPPIMEACKAGLQEAIDKKISLRDAHKGMSYILAGEKEWEDAISHYAEAMRHNTINTSTGDYIHLGQLYLKNGQLAEAEDSFLKGLDISTARERGLERIYGIYKREDRPDELYEFYEKAGSRYVGSSTFDILLARSLIDLKQYNRARRILGEINLKEPTAQAYYWLARIAKAEKDWNGMELAIQKATVLDPPNSGYHLIFSQVLKRRNKLERAEREAGRAIGHRAKPSSGSYNHRARIRWSRKDYPGALRDWKTAIALKPDRASYYAQAAEACIKMGDLSRAVGYYQKALKLEPGNQRYGKRYKKLKADN
ncbi:MAG: tetratricopeptide repeat protein [Deltaproteobacteria bacterium]|nr:tetratricopeptide repeat protein [Deltaproteobacteria bacterium]